MGIGLWAPARRTLGTGYWPEGHAARVNETPSHYLLLVPRMDAKKCRDGARETYRLQPQTCLLPLPHCTRKDRNEQQAGQEDEDRQSGIDHENAVLRSGTLLDDALTRGFETIEAEHHAGDQRTNSERQLL